MAAMSSSAPETNFNIPPPVPCDDPQVNHHQLRERDTRRERNSATIISVSSFFVSTCAALQAPVMPAELHRRGLADAWAAAPFVVYWIMLSIATTVIYRRAMKCKLFLLTGSIMTAIAIGLFGALQFLKGNTLFLIGAMVLRSFEAVGCAMYHEAGENYIRFHFDTNRRLYLGTNQSLYYFGFVFGPILGGMMYEQGSFYSPFVTCAVCLLVCCCVLFFVVDERCLEDSLTVSTLSYAVPFKAAHFLLVLAPYIAQGFNLCTMWFLLQYLGLSPIAVGVLIGLPDLTNAIVSPLSKSMVSIIPLPISVFFGFGTALTSFGVLYLGLGFPLNNYLTQNLAQACFALLIFGLGASYLLLAPYITEARTYRSFHSAKSLVSVWSFIGSIIGAGVSVLGNALILESHVAYTVVAGITAIAGFAGTICFALGK